MNVGGTLKERHRKCPVCGNEFSVLSACGWGYKIVGNSTKYFCRYNCLREYQRQMEEKRAEKERARIEAKLEYDRKLHKKQYEEKIKKEVEENGCEGIPETSIQNQRIDENVQTGTGEAEGTGSV